MPEAPPSAPPTTAAEPPQPADGAEPADCRGPRRLPQPLPALPAAFLAGRDLDLLAPLVFAPSAPPPLAPPRVERRELARALAAANAAYGHPRSAELGARLADPATRVVVAGQQPALFGGPLYTLTKLAAATLWAEALAARGEPAVAVFWVATEDHDWAELAQASFPGRDGPRTVDLGPDPAPLMPVGMRTFGPGVAAALAALGESLPAEVIGPWRERLARWYRPEARFGEAFGRLAVDLLGERCPLLVDAMLPEVKSAARPHLLRLVERRAEIETALQAREDAVRARGHALQVPAQPGAGQLFLLRGGERRRVLWAGAEAFALRGAESAGGGEPLAALMAAIAENPGVASPGVLARPAIQDAILGTALQVMGPGEISYLAQAAALYPVLEVAPPAVVLRPRAVVVDRHQSAQLEGLAPEEAARLLDARVSLDRWVAGRAGESFVAPIEARVAGALDELRAPALALDADLERPLAKTRETIARALATFAGKVDGAVARRQGVERQRAERLRAAALPGGRPQERVVSLAYLRGRYGERFGAEFLAALELDARCLQVLALEPAAAPPADREPA